MLRTLLLRSARKLSFIPDGERVYAIGDIHGRSDLFEDLLHLLRADVGKRAAAQTHIVIVGDFIDRGPDSARIISALRWWQRSSAHVTILKGNHEATLVDCAEGYSGAVEMWLKHGGAATLASFGIDVRKCYSSGEVVRLIKSEIGSPIISWLDELPLSHSIGDYFFCHAGVRPGVPLDHQDADDLLWIRSGFLDSTRDHGAVIVHGHSICGPSVEFAGNRICIDTGAYESGVLSAVGLESHKQWSVSTASVATPGRDKPHAACDRP